MNNLSGVYILKFKDDNCKIARILSFDDILIENSNEFCPSKIYNYFKDSKDYNIEDAMIASYYIETANPTKHGIKIINYDNDWNSILEKNK